MRTWAFLASMAVATTAAFPARADVSSFMAIGGGVGVERDSINHATSTLGALSGTIGVGTSPRNAFVLGGVFRSTTYFDRGTDVGVFFRGASGGFARGDWGFAIDLGAAGRFWPRRSYGAWPLEGYATFGAPLGFQAAIGVQAVNLGGGGVPTLGGVGLLEIDLLRLTVDRRGTGDAAWWNYSPAGGR